MNKDAIAIGGVQTSAIGNNMMNIEMVINNTVVVGVTKNV